MALFRGTAWHTAAVAAIITALQANPLYAADQLDGPVFEAGEVTEVEFGTGWYIRGDISASIGSGTSTYGTEDSNSDVDLGSPVGMSAGAGFAFGNTFRGEIMASAFTGLGYSARSASVSCGTYQRDVQVPVTTTTTTPGTTTTTADTIDVLTGATIPGTTVTTPGTTTTNTVLETQTQTFQDAGDCYTKWQSTIHAVNLMANVYYDAPEIMGFTPYVGAGIGLAYLSWSELKDLDLCSGGVEDEDCQDNGPGIHILREGEAQTTSGLAPAVNLMLGAGYRLNKNTTIDFGYRYTMMNGSTVVSASENAFYTEDTELGPLNVHEFKVGLRYEIW